MDKSNAATVETVDSQLDRTPNNHLAANTISKTTGTAHNASHMFVWMTGVFSEHEIIPF